MSCVRVLNFQSYFVSWETERSLSKEKELDSKTGTMGIMVGKKTICTRQISRYFLLLVLCNIY